MYYKRAKSIPYERLLSHNERKVFSACRSILDLDDIVFATELTEDEVVKIINTFISEGLVKEFDSYESAETHKE